MLAMFSTPSAPVSTSNNILLIIDPQNDFTDHPGEKKGSLAVDGALKDYEKIVKMLESHPTFFDQIHVSLDTHTPQHIGHPGFWKVISMDDKVTSQTEITAVPNSIYRLSIDEAGTINGENIVPVAYSPGTARYIKVVPRSDFLRDYVKTYLKWFDTHENTHGQRCYVWKQHCIENDDGHKVSEPLKSKLDEMGDKVTYHIKGQNNLAEMYSIFKAEKPLTNEEMQDEILKPYIYTGSKAIKGENAKTYDDVTTLKNLNTELNEELLKQLLGDKGENQNRVYICGEARTHCVKSSVIDLLEYATKGGYDTTKIILLKDATSPIPGTPNDILRIMTGKTVKDVDMREFDADEKKTGFDYSNHNYGKLYYDARAINTTDIAVKGNRIEGGSRKKGKTTKSRTRKNKKSSRNKRSNNKKPRSKKIR